MAEEKKSAEETSPKAPKPSLLENKVVVLGGIVVLQAILAIALTQFIIVPRLGAQSAGMNEEIATSERAAAAETGVLVSLDEIIATLQSEGPQARFVRTTVNVEVAKPELVEHVVARKAQLRDIVIMVVSQRTASALITPEGKKGLRDELTRRLAEKLPDGEFKGIYFSDLVIQ